MAKKQTETVFRHKRIKRKGRHSKKDKKIKDVGIQKREEYIGQLVRCRRLEDVYKRQIWNIMIKNQADWIKQRPS